MSGALDLLRAALRKRGVTGSISPAAEEMCGVMDHFCGLHDFDCEMYGRIAKEQAELIRKLGERVTALESR